MIHDAANTSDSRESHHGMDEFVDSPEYRASLQNEFPEGASEWTDPVTRRRFLGIMGASIAMAGAAGCIRPAAQRTIVPYTTQPDELTPGVPLFFATAAPLGGYGTGVLVRSREGRPIKVEGNPDHPSSLGGVGIFAQASVLDLYDPDRSRTTTHNGIPAAYARAVSALRKELYESTVDVNGVPNRDKQIRIVSEPITSPTLANQLTEFFKVFPNARWVPHDPAGMDNVREGIAKAFDKPVAIAYDFKKADVVLALDSDFLCMGPGTARYSRDFASRRKVRKDARDGVTPEEMNRLYAVECMPTSTGAFADNRLALSSAQIEAFARELAKELGVAGAPAAGALPDGAKAWLAGMAKDLKDRAKGKTLVVAGDHLPAHVHALVFAINNALGNIGSTVLQSTPFEFRPADKLIPLKQLTDEMAAKKVDVLLVFSSNPAYTAPADLAFADAAKNVRFKLHLGSHQDETAVLCEWHVPEAHYLETWGDIRGHDGTVTIQQPLIAPLYDGKSILEFLADVTLNKARHGLDLVKGFWRDRFNAAKASGEFEIAWQESVRSGVVKGSAPAPAAVAALSPKWAENSPPPAASPTEGQYEINFRPDPTLYDGRFANNGWLQELPKPLILICWDNAAFMSPATAAKLDAKRWYRWTAGEHGRAEVTVLELTYKDKKIKVPAWSIPGHADGAITLHLGYGRTRAGRVSTSPSEPNAEDQPVRGFNAYRLRMSDALWSAPGLAARSTDDTYFLAAVQGHWSMLQKDPSSGEVMNRMPARMQTLAEYERNPAFAKIPPTAPGETERIDENTPSAKLIPPVHEHEEPGAQDEDLRLIPLTMYNPMDTLSPDANPSQRRRWAMAIDLAACTGCSSCMIACQSENNSPVIGKYEVTRGRIMHWIRIDRYYGGFQEDPNPNVTSFQPVACVQCENVPCEVVCPVGATVHSVDGLNDMVYNRCVGTRYCSNNCPYKVRRFNFLTFADFDTDTLKLGRNPEVSVRSRGVMEKCTFCVQRIRAAEIVAEREARPIHDGEIMTACQAACPTGAIVFGDLNVADSVVNRWKSEPRNYGLLADLNTRPRLTHLAAIRNPNTDPSMPKGA